MKTLLTQGYGFTNWTAIEFVSKVGKHEIIMFQIPDKSQFCIQLRPTPTSGHFRPSGNSLIYDEFDKSFAKCK